MRRPRAPAFLIALFLLVPLGAAEDGVSFGDGNLPAGCTGDHGTANPTGALEVPAFTDDCYHMRTGLNDPDTPIIDVLLTPPVSPYPERDLRAMRQVVEMWEAGVDHLAPRMGMAWLAEGVQFNILVDDSEVTTDPAWDPEIVIVMANPVVAGVQGIGIDPLDFSKEAFGFDPVEDPCRGANPLATAADWEALTGFDAHHGGQSGTYVEECEGGGNVCFAVNLAIDPVPGVVDDVLGMNAFDLVAHEFGHCLSLGHVGDAGDHTASAVPADDIMSYTHRMEAGKCVSSLDVEALAVTMSAFLLDEPLVANHASGPGGSFQVQRKADHVYASSTGLAIHCPDPDLGLVPLGEPVDFTPGEPPGPTPPSPFPQPDGSVSGGLTIFSELNPAFAHNELAAIATGLAGDPRPKFTPGEPTEFHSRFTTSPAGLVRVGVDTFTWHLWDAEGTLVATFPCTTIPDDNGVTEPGFDCPGRVNLPTTAGVYFATARHDASGRFILDNTPDDPDQPGLKGLEVLPLGV